MADPSTHSSLPSASTPRALPVHPVPHPGRHPRRSSPSDDLSRSNRPSSQPRPAPAPSTTPRDTSPRDPSAMQRSVSPSEVTKYTKTGRISKAKKGLKVHLCESCGKSYTRAEHLRRHQQNHSGTPLQCDWPDCGKSFHRTDLLDRHKERHTDPNNDDRRSSVASQTSSAAYGSYQSAPIPPMTPREIATSMSEASASYEVPVSAGHLMDHAPTSTSSSGKPFPNANAFSRAAATISAGDVTYAGSLFGDYRWSPPPEPISCGGDYASAHVAYPELSYVPNPYPTYRPRTLSNASFIEPWSHSVPRSPPSPTSTQPFYWLDVERDPAMQNISFSGSSGIASYATSDTSIYPASTEHGPHFMAATTPPFRSFEELDAQEHCLLFPDQPLGIPVIDPIQSHRYLDHYWQYFHSHFPIKHKPTFDAQRQPPLLLAAMLAIGAQYDQHAGAKAEGRALHEKCLKALAKREHEHVSSHRAEDMQAFFLIELISQFRGKRASKSLSITFRNMYHSLCRDADAHATNIDEQANSAVTQNSSEYEIWQQWQDWINRSSKSRLLAACFIFEAEQTVLLARTGTETFISGRDLPRPAPTDLWNASDAWRWIEKLPMAANTGFEAFTTIQASARFDVFQTVQLLYTHEPSLHGTPTPTQAITSATPSLGLNRIDESPASKVVLHAISLASSTPLRSLLAVTGETWVLSTPIPKDAFEASKRELRDWINSLFAHPASADVAVQKPIGISLANALSVLSLAVEHDSTDCFAPGTEMALYYAALVLWAVVQGASTWRSTVTDPAAYFAGLALAAAPACADTTSAARNFLLSARAELKIAGLGPDACADTELLTRTWLADESALERWQDGATAVLAWTRGLLSGGEAAAEGPGELLQGAVRALERIGRRGWGGGGWF